MATLREELARVGFDFGHGRILYQETLKGSPGFADKYDVGEIVEIDLTHPILDFDYDNDYGDFAMPRFVAEDKDKIYFPCEYDGQCWVGWVYKNIDRYIEYGLTPYMGCG